MTHEIPLHFTFALAHMWSPVAGRLLSQGVPPDGWSEKNLLPPGKAKLDANQEKRNVPLHGTLGYGDSSMAASSCCPGHFQ